MPQKNIFMESTKVPPENSAAAIVELLVQIGARRVSMTYDDQRRLAGIDFTMVYGPLEFPFSIPARIQKLIDNKRFAPSLAYVNRQQMRRESAERVAWRQLYRWVQAQVALIDTGMVANIEVFIPYRMTPAGRTLFDVMIENEMKLLGPAEAGAA